MYFNSKHLGSLLYLILLVHPQSAFAAFDDIQHYWHWYLITMTLVAGLGAYFCIRHKANIENTGIKVLVWGVYFWVFMFAELSLMALLYHFFS